MKKWKLKRWLFLLLVPISILFTYLAKTHPDETEKIFSRVVYPALSQFISKITSFIPFSIAEVFVILSVLGAIVGLIFFILFLLKNRSRWKEIIIRATASLLAVASVLFFFFTINCALNYYRYPFTYYSGLEIRPSTQDELVELCRTLIHQANKQQNLVMRDQNGRMILSGSSIYQTAKLAQSAYQKLGEQYEVLAGDYAPPKPVLLSKAMSYCHISGIYFPFTFEANVNVDIPDYLIPSTMCHELTHLRGFMREDEANFLGFLACQESDSPDFQYSGTMLALVYSMNALYAVNPDLHNQLSRMYTAEVLNDFIYNAEYWKQFEGTVSRAATEVNDTYLKANSQQDGVESYGRMVDLLLAYYRQGGFLEA